jgi:release factor glutamine methyltransferase
LTITYPNPNLPNRQQDHRVYQPQSDSQLLVEAMRCSALIPGRRVLDLCTGSGYVAIAAAKMGSAGVVAIDICPRAVQHSRDNAAESGVDIDVCEGSWTVARKFAPFDVVVANPPYVPTPPGRALEAGPWWAWNAGLDGRLILDPLCASAPDLLCAGGTLLLVQSALAGVERSLGLLRRGGLDAKVVNAQTIPFGPVLSARADWLERTGRVRRGCRTEELIVIRADKS